MAMLSGLPVWVQWVAFVAILSASGFAFLFAIFVTWPFFRESMRTMRESHKVNRQLLSLIERLDAAEKKGEFRKLVTDLRKALKGGGLAGKL